MRLATQDLGRWSDQHCLEARVQFSESTGSGRAGYRTGVLILQIYFGEDRVAQSEERITFTGPAELPDLARKCALKAMARVRQTED